MRSRLVEFMCNTKPGGMVWQILRGYLRRRFHGEAFVYDGSWYRYLVHPYNTTWRNERAVEVPVALDFISSFRDNEVLEIGNVLSWYSARRHTVVDKHEQCDWRTVINQDLLRYFPDRLFSRIVCISTLEHIGIDEYQDQVHLVHQAVRRIRNMLAPRGEALITIPTGYNWYLDVIAPRVFDRVVSMVSDGCPPRVWRASPGYDWRSYMYNAKRAHAVAFCYLRNPAQSHYTPAPGKDSQCKKHP